MENVSKWFLENNADAAFPSLNGHLKLQKLLYYAQAMNLAVNENPMFENKILAFENGPVVKEMFIEYRHNNFVERYKSESPITNAFDDETEKMLQVVNYVYGTQTGNQLVQLTHSEKPWADLEEKAKNRENPEITQESIKEYYQPLKDIYELYEDLDFSSHFKEEINGNVFTYNVNETKFTEADYRDLWDLGEKVKGQKYFVYKDNFGEMVVY